jgi:hypothetical protein
MILGDIIRISNQHKIMRVITSYLLYDPCTQRLLLPDPGLPVRSLFIPATYT